MHSILRVLPLFRGLFLTTKYRQLRRCRCWGSSSSDLSHRHRLTTQLVLGPATARIQIDDPAPLYGHLPPQSFIRLHKLRSVHNLLQAIIRSVQLDDHPFLI